MITYYGIFFRHCKHSRNRKIIGWFSMRGATFAKFQVIFIHQFLFYLLYAYIYIYIYIYILFYTYIHRCIFMNDKNIKLNS